MTYSRGTRPRGATETEEVSRPALTITELPRGTSGSGKESEGWGSVVSGVCGGGAGASKLRVGGGEWSGLDAAC